MSLTRLKNVVFAAFAALAMAVTSAGMAQADNLLASRIGSVLGQERQALRLVPDNRLNMLTAPPPAQERGVEAAPSNVEYNRSFLASLPAASGGSQWECLAQALYFEARGESVEGMFAVGEVIMNRVDSSRFPNTVCSVVNQGTGRRFQCQFTYTCDGHPETIREPGAYNTVAKVARLLIDGAPRNLTGGATYYHTHAVNPRWARTFPRTASIGSHYFYRNG